MALQRRIVDESGRRPNRLGLGKDANEPAVSKDGRYVFYSAMDEAGTFQIWRASLKGLNRLQLTRGQKHTVDPSVSPDGLWVFYVGIAGLFFLSRRVADHVPMLALALLHKGREEKELRALGKPRDLVHDLLRGLLQNRPAAIVAGEAPYAGPHHAQVIVDLPSGAEATSRRPPSCMAAGPQRRVMR